MSTSHWEKVLLSEIAEVRLGRQRSPKRSVGPNMRPYMRAANVTWNGISLHDVKEMDFTPEEFETGAALFRRSLSRSFIRVYAIGHRLCGAV